MTLDQFIVLNDVEKAEAVYRALFISERIAVDYKYRLFYLASGDFYVEAQYDLEKDELKSFRPFQSQRYLEPYTDEFSVLELMF